MMRIFRFIALVILGYAGIFIVYVIALNLADHLPDDAHLYNFRLAYFGGGLMALILGTALGVVSFFTTGRIGRIFLFLPCLTPIVYSAAIMMYFLL